MNKKELEKLWIMGKIHCTRCRFSETCTTNRMRGNGPTTKGGILVLAEAPGADEDRMGVPLVGKAGTIYHSAADTALEGIPVYETNSMKCYPGDIKVKPIKAELEACRPWFLREVHHLEPKLILAMGAIAVQQIFQRKYPVEFVRGRILDWEYGGRKIPVLCTYHPASLLYKPENEDAFISDIIKAREIYNNGVTGNLLLSYQVLEDISELEKLETLGRTVGLDCETGFMKDGVYVPSADIYRPEFRIVSMAFYDGKKCFVVPGLLIAHIFKFLDSPKRRFVIHNASFDIQAILSLRCTKIKRYLDTQTLDGVRRPGGQHSLEVVSGLYAPELGNWKSESEAMKRGESVPMPVLYKRNAYDAAAHFLVAKAMLKQAPLTKLDKMLYRSQTVLRQISERGIMVDAKKAVKTRQLLETKTNALLQEINREDAVKALHLKTEFNPNSTVHLRRLFFDKLKLEHPSIPKTEKGELSTSKEMRQFFLDVPVVEKIDEYLKITYVLSNIFDEQKLGRWIEYDGRVHTSYNIHSTVTGRLSSSNPNLQNISADPERTLGIPMRSIFTPRSGCVFVEWDWSQIELRWLGHESRDPFIIEAYKNDEDLHQKTADLINSYGFNITRKGAKTANFAIAYGVTKDKLIRTLTQESETPITDEIAEMILAHHAKIFKTMYAWAEKIKREARANGELTTIFGRHRDFKYTGVRHEDEHLDRAAVNFKIQSPASDCTTLLLVPLASRFPMVATVHDSVLFEVSRERVDDLRAFREEAESLINEKLKLKVQLKLEEKIGTDWAFTDQEVKE